MRVILFGTPGAGKGTQSKYICEKFNIPQISASHVLHEAISKGTLNADTHARMEAGELVSDEVIIELIKERIKQPDCKNGYLFDGFPRTIPQAHAINHGKIEIDYVIEIFVADEEVIKRLTGRRIHSASGRAYHVIYNPPKIPGQDDITGEPLIQREDDTKETICKRLTVYHEQTEPLRNFYKDLAKKYNSLKYFQVDGSGSVAEVRNRIFEVIKQR